MGHAERTLSFWLRQRAGVILDPGCALLSRLRIHPNLLSVLGLLFAIAAGGAIAVGRISMGGWLLAVSGPFDAFDGALARSTGKESVFGAFLDSFLDRYSEAALLFGISYWAVGQGHHTLVFLSFLTLFGSVMVSYARARAEGLNIACSVGLFTRVERFMLLVVTLLSGQLVAGLFVMALMANFTALQRLYHVYRQVTR